MAAVPDLYSVLGVAETAGHDEIRRAYLTRAREEHPDKVAPAERAAATARFQQLQEAHETLTDPRKRRA